MIIGALLTFFGFLLSVIIDVLPDSEGLPVVVENGFTFLMDLAVPLNGWLPIQELLLAVFFAITIEFALFTFRLLVWSDGRFRGTQTDSK